MTVAYQGQPGAFSHQACLTFLAGHDAVALPTFAEVIAAVQRAIQLHLGGIATDVADQLTLHAVVQRLGDEFEGRPNVVSLTNEHAKVDGVAAQFVNCIRNDDINLLPPGLFAERRELGPLP